MIYFLKFNSFERLENGSHVMMIDLIVSDLFIFNVDLLFFAQYQILFDIAFQP